MAMDDMSMSPQRKAAHLKWRQAEQEAHKGHHEKAVDLARSGLEEDPELLELRMWLAQVFVKMDEPRKAVHELEEIIQIRRDHPEAWELLKQVDPPTAQRLERLQTIAPDPFVMQRTAELTDDIGDIEELEEGDLLEAAPAESAMGAVGKDPFHSGAGQSDAFGDLGEQDADEGEEQAEAAAPVAAAGEQDRGGHVWEYEQDREFLARWEAEKVVADMAAKIQELWDDVDAWDPVLALCAHADHNIHPQIFEALGVAAERLGVAAPELHVFPERCMHPVIIKDRPPMIAVPTGLIRAMNLGEMIFQIGREIGHIHTGYVAQMQVVKIITDRKAQLVGDLASTLRDFLGDQLEYWNEGLGRDELARIKKLGHAWQQRCELTADRAGLVCCEGADLACSAIAKTTAKSVDEASTLTSERLLQQFEGYEVGQLAAIPVEESPSRNPNYAAYRIQMLKWWATTPECRQAMSG